jgi:hypothetical protein
MQNKGYIEREIVDHLSQFCSFETGEDYRTSAPLKVLTVQSGSLGIKRLGMVDFLVNHCKYRLLLTRGSVKGRR